MVVIDFLGLLTSAAPPPRRFVPRLSGALAAVPKMAGRPPAIICHFFTESGRNKQFLVRYACTDEVHVCLV